MTAEALPSCFLGPGTSELCLFARYGIEAGQLTLHQDRGSPMIAHGYLESMMALDVTCSHSRPRVSNDNPFRESQFQTQKYPPDYPGRFDSLAHARRWCEENTNRCYLQLTVHMRLTCSVGINRIGIL